MSSKGHIYLIRAQGTNRYKIGLTSEGRLVNRFEELNSSQSAYPLEMIHAIDVADRFDAEKALHRAFKQHRKYGEWFELGNREVKIVTSEMNSLSIGGVKGEAVNLPLLLLGVAMILVAIWGYDRNSQKSYVIPATSQELTR